MDFKGNLNRWRRYNVRPMSSPVSPQDLTTVSYDKGVEMIRKRNTLCHNIQPAVKGLRQDQC